MPSKERTRESLYVSICLPMPQRSRPVLAPPTSVRQILSLVCTDRIFIHGVPGASLDLFGQNIWGRSNWSNCDVADSLTRWDFLFTFIQLCNYIDWRCWDTMACVAFDVLRETQCLCALSSHLNKENMNQCKSLLGEDLLDPTGIN